jgi:phage-related minor tail protein
MTTEVVAPNTEKLDAETSAIVTTANSIEIQSNDDLALSGEFLKRVKRARGILNDTFDNVIKKAHKAHKAAVAAKRQHEEPLTKAERIVKGKVSAYTTEQERIRRAKEARLAEQARKEAEEAQLAEAARLEAAGDHESAEAVIEAPTPAVPVVVPKTVSKVQGMSTRKVWKYRIVEPNAIPRNWMVPDERAIRAHARSMKERASIPGVEFYSEDSVAVSAF